jgi:glycosyltransferase involved in cell wall biosynthesis
MNLPESARKEVVFIRTNIPHYRVSFYNSLKDRLELHGINLRVLYSHADKLALADGFDLDLPWAELVDMKWFPGGAIWHAVLGRVQGADLIVVEDASRNLLNYVLFLKRRFGGPRFALWGHGWNHTEPPNRLGEWIKGAMGKRSDWYFAYTGAVKRELVRRGYQAAKISDVQNCLPPLSAEASPQQCAELRSELGLPEDATVVLYCGRMYSIKRLGFLIAAANRVHELLPGFHLILGGGGPDQHLAADADREHAYIHFLGPLHEPRKAAAYKISRLVAMPGLVGLALVDAFQHHRPLVTTAYPYQAPEIDYMESGINGVTTEDDLEAFAQGIYKVATDNDLHARLVAGCQTAAETITFDTMVDRFAEGILQALDLDAGS